MSDFVKNINEFEWYGKDLAIAHTMIRGKAYKVILESED